MKNTLLATVAAIGFALPAHAQPVPRCSSFMTAYHTAMQHAYMTYAQDFMAKLDMQRVANGKQAINYPVNDYIAGVWYRLCGSDPSQPLSFAIMTTYRMGVQASGD